MANSPNCSLCGHDPAWHDKHHPRHTFNGDAISLNAKPQVVAESEPETEWRVGPGKLADQWVQPQHPLIDPVLRMALVNAGVITVEQIDAAQRMSDTLNGTAHEPTHFAPPD